MSDNTQLNPGWGGDVIRTHDDSGIKTQVVMVAGVDPAGAVTKTPVTEDGFLLDFDSIEARIKYITNQINSISRIRADDESLLLLLA